MKKAIFLSASIPDPRRNKQYALTADIVAIQSAVSALVYVTLGRRILVWGGHPSITPMIHVAASDLGVNYQSWVKLYQSEYFSRDFPADNTAFNNVTYTRRDGGKRAANLKILRQRMFTDQQFSAAVFIGGMKGIVDEYKSISRLQPEASVIPLASTGGAALEVAKRIGSNRELLEDLDYVTLFHRVLQIPFDEERSEEPQD